MKKRVIFICIALVCLFVTACSNQTTEQVLQSLETDLKKYDDISNEKDVVATTTVTIKKNEFEVFSEETRVSVKRDMSACSIYVKSQNLETGFLTDTDGEKIAFEIYSNRQSTSETKVLPFVTTSTLTGTFNEVDSSDYELPEFNFDKELVTVTKKKDVYTISGDLKKILKSLDNEMIDELLGMLVDESIKFSGDIVITIDVSKKDSVLMNYVMNMKVNNEVIVIEIGMELEFKEVTFDIFNNEKYNLGGLEKLKVPNALEFEFVPAFRKIQTHLDKGYYAFVLEGVELSDSDYDHAAYSSIIKVYNDKNKAEKMEFYSGWHHFNQYLFYIEEEGIYNIEYSFSDFYGGKYKLVPVKHKTNYLEETIVTDKGTGTIEGRNDFNHYVIESDSNGLKKIRNTCNETLYLGIQDYPDHYNFFEFAPNEEITFRVFEGKNHFYITNSSIQSNAQWDYSFEITSIDTTYGRNVNTKITLSDSKPTDEIILGYGLDDIYVYLDVEKDGYYTVKDINNQFMFAYYENKRVENLYLTKGEYRIKVTLGTNVHVLEHLNLLYTYSENQ